MKLYSLAVFILAVGFIGCVASPTPAPQDPSLDEVIQQAAERMEERLDAGTQVALINVQSPVPQFSEYILTYLEFILVNNGKLIVVDRSNLDKIRQELGFQLSGEVSDESAKSIGKMLGAGAIVTGSFLTMGNSSRLTLKAINVETATVASSYSADISKWLNEQYRALPGNTAVAAANGQTSTPAQPAATQPATTYKIGDTGPAGGIIFYDKGNSRDGWRYLEAAPADTEKTASGPPRRKNAVGRKVGDGKENANIFIQDFEQKGGGINSSIWLCDNLTLNGFNDWYLPSLDELLYIYNNLYSNGIGGFKSTKY